MGRATTQIETRLSGVDATAAAFASVKKRFNQFDKGVMNKNLNPFAGFGKTNFAKGVGAGFKDLNNIGKALGGGVQMATNLGASLVKASMAAAAVGVAIGGIVAKKGLDAIFEMDKLGDAAQKIGMTSNELKRMERVFSQAGIGGRELAEQIIPKMTRALGEKTGQDAIEKLGLSMSEIQRMTPEQRFVALGAAIADVGNDIERAQIETDLFGRSGVALDAIFRQGGAAFKQAYSDVGALAATVDEQGVAAAGRFADAWNVAKDRGKTAWQNLVGGMLTSFEEKFGPIDKWLLGVWEDASAAVKIFWLEFTTNGPAIVMNFFKNATKFVEAFIGNWREGLSWIWESYWNYVYGLITGIGKLGKALWQTLKGNPADWADVKASFQTAIPDFSDLTKRLGIKWSKAELVDLTAEKEKIRALAAARKLQDAKSLDSANTLLQAATSANLMHAAEEGAEALTTAVETAMRRDASALASGSYDAFKLRYGPGSNAGVMAGGAGALQGGQGGVSAGGPAQVSATVMPQMLTELRAILAALKDGARDRTIIRESVEAIGVA